MSPSLTQLKLYTSSQLTKVDNFTIQNKWAEVVFIDPVDLTGVDLDKIVSL